MAICDWQDYDLSLIIGHSFITDCDWPFMIGNKCMTDCDWQFELC